MLDDTRSGMQCIEWEALLADALDGTLHGSTLAGFEEHQKACPTCHAMYEEVAAGLHWMKALDEAEPPKYLVHNILAQTIGALPVETAPAATPGESWWERLKGRVGPVFAPVFSPRFAMSFGMAFFSITMLLNVAGFHVSDLKHVDLSRKGIEKTYYIAQARVVRYYENIRLVYEIESRVRDLRRAATPDKKQEEPNTQKEPKGQTQRQQNRKYENSSRDVHEPVLAACPAAIMIETPQARLNRRTA